MKVEELEAIRLKDLEGLEQEECAKRMEVSRPTFQRILTTARIKVADSLVHGKTLRISGGTYTKGICPVRCFECGHIWEESIERLHMLAEKAKDPLCPICQSANITCQPDEALRPRGLSRDCPAGPYGRGQGPCGGFHGGGRRRAGPGGPRGGRPDRD